MPVSPTPRRRPAYAQNPWTVTNLGPSKELHADHYGKNGAPIGWDEFRRRYVQEMAAQQDYINELADMVAEGKTITLLCSSACSDETHCHRTLLKGLIEERMAELQKK